MESLTQLGMQAKKASRKLAQASAQEKNQALLIMSRLITEHQKDIIAANQKDLAAAESNGIKGNMLDRLALNEERISAMAEGIKQVAELPDPVGTIESMRKLDNGLTIGRQSVPLGVIGIIYESRPNVTTDAGVLCFKSGNAVILRGGKEAIHTNKAIITVLQKALSQTDFPQDSIQLVEDTSRASSTGLMTLTEYLDVLIPRGGAGLIKAVVENATVPVIETGVGNCHIYIDKDAQLEMAKDIIVNAKCSRPSVCNAAETLLIHEDVAAAFLPEIETALSEYHVELRADEKAGAILAKSIPATEEDWETEFLDYILAVKVIPSLEEAVEHIDRYSTGHSEAIVTDNYAAGQQFLREVDSAAVYINASTRFTDGFEFGFGAEIGISTQKIHARGPMGLPELTSYKTIVYGNGQIR
ncbi:glutamate-5-semialdehyde dehydrogenase [Desemzia sp. RIT804]|uniref:glutamate-5-semialdehyde dehydrogenase n=1 Tax=Desemzia sp. RIT 804 TaxID=2810209 RepID=UPI0019518278|nr:glutamate-5-semialdehyde dehydrogenase [Desemzia sp. RIT 804]MBM6615986.1 glutamate-5-semialdehyde dehydrogenase [Desemzia sp. RIT 804]